MAREKTSKKNSRPGSVDEYIATLRPEVCGRLEELRRAVNAAAPGAVESISYGMPMARLGAAKVYYSAWKSHCAVYGLTVSALETHREEIKDFVTEKGALIFPHNKPVPLALLTALVRAQFADVESAGIGREERRNRGVRPADHG